MTSALAADIVRMGDKDRHARPTLMAVDRARRQVQEDRRGEDAAPGSKVGNLAVHQTWLRLRLGEPSGRTASGSEPLAACLARANDENATSDAAETVSSAT